jgi:hypothetical protein
MNQCELLLKLKLNYDLQSVGQSVLVSGTRLGPVTNFSLSLKLSTIAGLLFCSALSDERTDCNLLLLLALASAVPSGLSPTLLKTILYFPNSWDSPILEGQVPVFISPRNRVAQIYPRALGSLSVASYDSQGCGGGILSRLHTGYPAKDKVKVVLVSGAHLGPATNFSFSLKFSLDCYRFVIL